SDDSGVALTLRWVAANVNYSPALSPQDVEAHTLFNQSKLEELGFECRLAPSDPKADAYYSRRSARTGFVALEYDGPAWQSWIELRERLEPSPGPGQKRAADYERESGSRLVAIDAGRDADAVRARHPQTSRVLVLPAVIRISLAPAWPATKDNPGVPARLVGYIQEV